MQSVGVVPDDKDFVVADDDAMLVTPAPGDFIDDVWASVAGAFELLEHVLLLEALDGMPVRAQLRRHVLDRAAAAAAAPRITCETLSVQRVLQQKIQFLPTCAEIGKTSLA